MEKEQDSSPIQQLPYEVLCRIFDFLDLQSVKQCSRTCRRWREIVFSDDYIKRFKLSITLPLSSLGEMQTLKQSDRLYSHVNLRITPYTFPADNGDLFNGVYTIFCYPKLEQLVTLKVAIPMVHNNATRMITDAIKRMQVLRELHIDTSSGSMMSSNKMVQFPIRSDSIQSLVAKAIIPIVVHAPKLLSFRIMVYANQTVPNLNEKLLYSNQLLNLKHLEFDKSLNDKRAKVANRGNVNHVLRFFSSLKSLETLQLKKVHTYGYLFKAICEHCINLTELFIESLHIMETSTLRHLSNLTNLRHLTFGNIVCLDPVAFREVRLPKLESLAIGSFPIAYETLTAFKFATKITILGGTNVTDLITAAATKMPNLKHIELEQFSESTLQSLNLLTSVEVLTVRFSIPELLWGVRTVTNIKQIHSLKTTIITASDIKRLRTHFPKLQLLKVGDKFKQSFLN